MLFFFPSLEHDSDGENDSENSDGGNEYQDDDDDDDDYGDDGEGFATRKSVGKHFFDVGGFWLVSFFLSFFLSFSQNSFFFIFLLLARYEKRIPKIDRIIIKLSHFLLCHFLPTTTRRRRNDERKNFDAL